MWRLIIALIHSLSEMCVLIYLSQPALAFRHAYPLEKLHVLFRIQGPDAIRCAAWIALMSDSPPQTHKIPYAVVSIGRYAIHVQVQHHGAFGAIFSMPPPPPAIFIHASQDQTTLAFLKQKRAPWDHLFTSLYCRRLCFFALGRLGPMQTH